MDIDYLFMRELFEFLGGAGLLAAPLIYIWMKYRHRAFEMNKRTEIVMAALEKNGEVDVDELLRKFNGSLQTPQERILQRLNWGCILTALGFGLLFAVLWLDWRGGLGPASLQLGMLISSSTLLVGIGYLVAYFLSKHVLEKEAERKQQDGQA